MSIRIGDKNKIKKSKIGHTYNSNPPQKGFVTRHPFLSGVLISIVAGFIMLFSFWENIVKWIESIFK